VLARLRWEEEFGISFADDDEIAAAGVENWKERKKVRWKRGEELKKFREVEFWERAGDWCKRE